MAESKSNPTPRTTDTDKPVAAQADHDRVAMLSIQKDGTPDQTDPEFIGPKDAAIEATTEQLSQIAVAAVDAAEGPVGGAEEPEQRQDAAIAERQKLHEKAAAGAEKQAEALVNELHAGK
jgi:hypothetical protein